MNYENALADIRQLRTDALSRLERAIMSNIGAVRDGGHTDLNYWIFRYLADVYESLLRIIDTEVDAMDEVERDLAGYKLDVERAARELIEAYTAPSLDTVDAEASYAFDLAAIVAYTEALKLMKRDKYSKDEP